MITNQIIIIIIIIIIMLLSFNSKITKTFAISIYVSVR
jgi:hypothetical protein